MSFTETTRNSWFSRLKSGLVGLVIGPLLVFGMIWLLSWNEGRSVQTYRALSEGAGLVVSVASGTVDPANEGKLVHVSGSVTPQGTPEDPILGIAAQGAAGLSRRVDMYQWIEDSKSETKKTLGGGEETVTTYSYSKAWRSGRVDSSDFKQPGEHQNPDMPIEGERFLVENAALGAFTIDGKAVADIAKDKAMPLTADQVSRISAALGTGRSGRLEGTTVYVSGNRQSPSIGDLRVSFTREDISEASFVGAQKERRVTGYRASNGRELFLSAAGLVDAPTLFDAAQSENTLITWVIRAAGLLGMFIGFILMLSILGIIADVIPFIGSIVGFGTSVVAGVLTLILGPLVIAIAWIAYRPVLAVAIITAGALLAAGLIYLRRGKTSTAQPAQTPTFGRR
ncbi:TMEM43 family protein [Pararhizobium gei]|uniref:TMEM43 family protein n=1 Tax=Pararhizobium gei TaxID=1395951 RepID=UPI0023DA0DB3|nr:TMEM43 family protein [Rhizobium gei]